jgi:hypothetical protein
MSVIKTIPKSSRFHLPFIKFTANFNVPTLGEYDFNQPANQNKVIFPSMLPSSIYMIERINFSATIPEGDFLEALDVTPQALFRYNIERYPVYMRPLTMVKYVDNMEAVAYFSSLNRAEQLVIDFTGKLFQTAALVGVPSITVEIELNVYEIIDQDWIKAFNQSLKNDLRIQ